MQHRPLPVLQQDNVLDRLGVASPCDYDWEAMQGDDRVRRCPACPLDVYNLSAMTRAEAAALIRRREGRMCVRMLKRADGTLISRDCRAVLREARRRGWWALVAALIIVGVTQTALRVVGAYGMLSLLWQSRPAQTIPQGTGGLPLQALSRLRAAGNLRRPAWSIEEMRWWLISTGLLLAVLLSIRVRHGNVMGSPEPMRPVEVSAPTVAPPSIPAAAHAQAPEQLVAILHPDAPSTERHILGNMTPKPQEPDHSEDSDDTEDSDDSDDQIEVVHVRSDSATPPPAERYEADRQALEAAVHSVLPELNRCYREAMARDPKLRGDITIEMTVAPQDSTGQGVIEEAEIDSEGLQAPLMEQCLLAALVSAKLPKPQARLYVSYPFTLNPDDHK